MNLNSNGKQNMRSFINTTITMLMFFDKKIQTWYIKQLLEIYISLSWQCDS